MSDERETWVDRMRPAPERTFGNPFAAWHYRTLDKSMYFTDVDGVEIEGTYPVIVYEIKTINASLFKAVLANEEHTNAHVAADFFGRFNMWQITSLNRLVRPGLQKGYVIVTPTNCQQFGLFDFEWVFDHLGPTGDIRERMNTNDGLFGIGKIRKLFWEPDYLALRLKEERRCLADQWRWAEHQGLV